MAKVLYTGISSKARKVKKLFIGIDGKARKVKKAYIGVGNKARLFFSSGYSTSISGLYAIDSYDHRRLAKLNESTYAIESSVSISSIDMSTSHITPAGGSSGLLWLATAYGNNSIINNSANIVDSRTGLAIKSLKDCATDVTGWFSGGTTNMLYKANTPVTNYRGTFTVNKLDPDTITSVGSFVPWADFSRTSNLNTVCGGNESRVWVYISYSVRDDGQTDHYPKLWEHDIVTGSRTRELSVRGGTSTAYKAVVDYLNGLLYKREWLNPSDGETKVLDFNSLAEKSKFSTIHDLYWQTNLITVK